MLCRPLDFDPGSEYAYSNFGYCLLGRVIEKRSGQDYETYVRKEVQGRPDSLPSLAAELVEHG